MANKTVVGLTTYSTLITVTLLVYVIMVIVKKAQESSVRDGAIRVAPHQANDIISKGIIPWKSKPYTPFPKSIVLSEFKPGDMWEIRRAKDGGRVVTRTDDDPNSDSKFVFEEVSSTDTSITYATTLTRNNSPSNPYIKITLTPTSIDYIDVNVVATLGYKTSTYAVRFGRTMLPSSRDSYFTPDTFFMPMYSWVKDEENLTTAPISADFCLYFAKVQQ